ncbi:hypothetical protein, partial [Moorena sp. SIO3H5]|uniref:hypothetical protein n=1 Tax=Moorena sp. SIO3H5 TaxID=2607834 RepID=UPI0013B938EB
MSDRISQSQLNVIDMQVTLRESGKASALMRSPLARLRRSHSQFFNYSDIDAVAHSGHHTTSLALHSLHTYHTLATFIPIPCSLAPKLGY